MKRRDFIKMLAVSGMGAGMAPLLSQRSFAEGAAGGSDQFLVVVGADGGWDTTSFFDPKGQSSGVNRVDIDPSLVTKSGIQWSAISAGLSADANVREAHANLYKNFFTTYDENLTIIKGLNTLTISHVVGSAMKFSGMYGTYPCLSALFGAVHGPEMPLSFLSFGSQYGGADNTAGLEVTRALLGDGSTLGHLATPSLGGADAEIYDMVQRAHFERLQRQIALEKRDTGLPLRARKLEELLTQRLKDNMFNDLRARIEEFDAATTAGQVAPHWTGGNMGFKQQGKVAAASMATGLSSTASLSLQGFDSHKHNDARQFSLLGTLVEGLHFLRVALDYYGIADKTTIVVSSDLGRTPHYNADGGKDHSTNGGMMILHPKNSGRGGQVFGATNHLGAGVPIDLNTGEENNSGTHLNVQHMMLALRDHFGLRAKAADKDFDFDSNLIMPGVFA